MTFNGWMLKNEDRLNALWTEHLQTMQNSSESIRTLSRSDNAYREFCEEIYEEETNQFQENPALKAADDAYDNWSSE